MTLITKTWRLVKCEIYQNVNLHYNIVKKLILSVSEK